MAGLSANLLARLAPGMAEAVAQDAIHRGPELETGRADLDAHRARGRRGADYWVEGTPEPQSVEDHEFAGADGSMQRVRIYRGSLGGPAPVFLYIYGGGWMSGSIEQNEPLARTLAAQSGWTVVAISYRLAPENPYPAGLDDCVAGFAWLKAQAGALGLDANKIVVGGTSAGANLALSTALRGGPGDFVGLLLFYGVFGSDFNAPSYQEFAGAGLSLDRPAMLELFEFYYPSWQQTPEPLVTPLLADLSGMPKSLLIGAELDVLRSDTEIMHERMKAAGVSVVTHMEEGVLHGFINRGRLVPAANESLAVAARFLTDLT